MRKPLAQDVRHHRPLGRIRKPAVSVRWKRHSSGHRIAQRSSSSSCRGERPAARRRASSSSPAGRRNSSNSMTPMVGEVLQLGRAARRHQGQEPDSSASASAGVLKVRWLPRSDRSRRGNQPQTPRRSAPWAASACRGSHTARLRGISAKRRGSSPDESGSRCVRTASGVQPSHWLAMTARASSGGAHSRARSAAGLRSCQLTAAADQGKAELVRHHVDRGRRRPGSSG